VGEKRSDLRRRRCARRIKKAASPNLYLDCRMHALARRSAAEWISIFKVVIASIFGHCLIGSARGSN
jgi:hypothetical protein